MDIRNCEMCPNKCKVDRLKSTGFCGEGIMPRVARAALHYWEEPIISGKNGSGAIFFSGCSMRCVYCQNYEISHNNKGEIISEDRLISIIKELEQAGAHNINFVNPTHFTHILKNVLTKYTPTVPVIYNTSGYERVKTLKELEGLINIYLPDLKYYDNNLALKYSGKSDYFEYASKAIAEMVKQCGNPVITNGIMKNGCLVRHMVLPNHSSDSVKIMEYLVKTYGDKIFISAMSQYTPYGDAFSYRELSRKIKKIEYTRVIAKLKKLIFEQCFIQDIDSSSTEFIPDFYNKL